jgi:hypothetical protein
MVLGDGSLVKRKGNKNYYLTISTVNKELSDHYYKILKYLTNVCIVKRKKIGGFSSNRKLLYQLTTNCHPIYSKLAAQFYQGIPRRKSIHPFLKNLTEYGLYLWFLGDGSCDHKTVNLHTENFSRAENEMIRYHLERKWKLDPRVSRTKSYYYLRFSGKNRIKLFKLLEPFLNIVPSMRYKFPITEEIQRAIVSSIVKKKANRKSNGQWTSGSRDDLIFQEIERLKEKS